MEFESHTLALVLALIVASGGVLFSLGVLTGMGWEEETLAVVSQQGRPPEAGPKLPEAKKDDKVAVREVIPVAAGKAKAGPGQQAEAKGAKGVKEDALLPLPSASPTEALLQGNKKTLTRSNQLLAELERKLEADEAKAKAAKARTAQKRPVSAARNQERYSVQVFASQNQGSADELIARLRRMGFDAYMNQHQTKTETWFRVRVGRVEKEAAEKLAKTLREQALVRSTKMIKL